MAEWEEIKISSCLFTIQSESIRSTLIQIFSNNFLPSLMFMRNLQIKPLSDPSVTCFYLHVLHFKLLFCTCEHGMKSSELEPSIMGVTTPLDFEVVTELSLEIPWIACASLLPELIIYIFVHPNSITFVTRHMFYHLFHLP